MFALTPQQPGAGSEEHDVEGARVVRQLLLPPRVAKPWLFSLRVTGLWFFE